MLRVQSGDGLDAFMPERTAVTYIGVDAPSGNTPCGQAAAERHRQLAANGLYLEEERGFSFDGGGLRLFHAFMPSGESVALVLIEEGLARAVDEPHRLRQAYLAAEARAKSAKRGCLWAGARSNQRAANAG